MDMNSSDKSAMIVFCTLFVCITLCIMTGVICYAVRPQAFDNKPVAEKVQK